jgi:hypothetical protein
MIALLSTLTGEDTCSGDDTLMWSRDPHNGIYEAVLSEFSQSALSRLFTGGFPDGVVPPSQAHAPPIPLPDVVVALMPSDQENLAVLTLAKQRGVGRLVTRASDPTYLGRFMALRALVTDPTSALVSLVTSFVTSADPYSLASLFAFNALSGDDEEASSSEPTSTSVAGASGLAQAKPQSRTPAHRFGQRDAQADVLRVSQAMQSLVGKRLVDTPFPEDVLIAGVFDSRSWHHPHDDMVLTGNEEILLVGSRDSLAVASRHFRRSISVQEEARSVSGHSAGGHSSSGSESDPEDRSGDGDDASCVIDIALESDPEASF